MYRKYENIVKNKTKINLKFSIKNDLFFIESKNGVIVPTNKIREVKLGFNGQFVAAKIS